MHKTTPLPLPWAEIKVNAMCKATHLHSLGLRLELMYEMCKATHLPSIGLRLESRQDCGGILQKPEKANESTSESTNVEMREMKIFVKIIILKHTKIKNRCRNTSSFN